MGGMRFIPLRAQLRWIGYFLQGYIQRSILPCFHNTDRADYELSSRLSKDPNDACNYFFLAFDDSFFDAEFDYFLN